MTDYRLDGLSPRLFEHVVQALAVGAITSTVTPFGDGPDGGREATFEGETGYGPEPNPWRGYGIIQAKYRTRTQDTYRDARWACSELRKELKQYTRAKQPRRIPDYYIFATNVTLSPGENGGKEKISRILDDFARGRNLEYDIWDYDKLRVLIDRDEAVRKAYLAWISPSDVLAELCEYLGARKKDYYKIILRYLQRELLADQHAQLEQGGHSADEAIPLAQVFIDLPTSLKQPTADGVGRHDPHETRRFVSRIIYDSGFNLSSKESNSRVAAPETHQYARIGRSVLIGGPGQGKTTVAQYICQVFRCAILADVDPNCLDQTASNALHDFMERWTAEGYEPPSARRLPFRIVLSDFAKSLAAGKTRSLMGYLAVKLCSHTDISISAEEVERVLTEYPTIIILDGLDEVPSSTNRDELLSAVTNFSIDVATSNLDTYILATTRPQGYNDEFSPKQYTHHYLLPLAAEDALKYGGRLAKIRFGANEDRLRKVIGRLGRAVGKPATARLMRTPLQVTILTLLVDRMGDPPEERWNLFREYYQLIYDRETERDIESVAVLKEHRVDVEAIHRRVGIALQVESERSGGTDARLTSGQFGQIVEDYLSEEGHKGQALVQLKKRIIDAAAYRLVFLVGMEAEQVGFEIRSLQEFMAAEGVIDGSDETVRNRLRAIASSSHWRNVFLFAAGKCFSDRRYLRDTIQAICAELNDDPADESLRMLLVGSELALDLLEDGPARRTPLARSTLTRLVLQLLGSPFREVSRIASICEEDTRYIFLEDLRNRLSTDSGLSSQNAWGCLAALADRHGGEFQELAQQVLTSRSISEAEFLSAVDAANGQNQWLNDVLYEMLEARAPSFKENLDIEMQETADNQRHYGPWKTSDYSDWLGWYAKYNEFAWSIPSGLYINLLDKRGKPYSSTVQRLSSGVSSPLIPPADLPSKASWDPLRKLGAFCGSPNATSLAEVLRSYGESKTQMLENRLAIFHYPWPLAEVLLASSVDRNAGILDAVESGNYGDVDEWSSVESRFESGIPLEELRDYPIICPTSDGGLFKFPFRAASMMAGIHPSSAGKGQYEVGNSLLGVFDAVDSEVVRSFISQLIIGSIRSSSSRIIYSWAERVIFFRCSSYRFFDPYFFTLIDSLNLLDRKWSDLFAGYGVQVFGGSNPTVSGASITLLANTVFEHEDLRGLLVALAISLSSSSPAKRKEILGDRFFTIEGSAVVRTAAIILNLMAGADISRVEADIGGLLPANPSLFMVIMLTIRQLDLPYKEELRQIMAVVHIAHADRSAAWRFLSQSFERRPSKLLEVGEWERLELPFTMRSVLDLIL